MDENIIVTSGVAQKRKTLKEKSTTSQDSAVAVESLDDKKLIFYSSGSGYVTKKGYKFSPSQRIYELDIEEADLLLKLDNFRRPDQLELEEYYKENK